MMGRVNLVRGYGWPAAERQSFKLRWRRATLLPSPPQGVRLRVHRIARRLLTLVGRELGADLLADALRRIAVASQSLGVGAAPVQAKDDAARRCYLRCAEFEDCPEESRRLYLPIETVVAAFG
ncbi:hypothetical protein CC_0976 [Caulobacter vibrioides CB15]|uniref:Uncharacterized protein n=2 Tax=Caulobacter vibrioides TaxID=155892 RepID=Q9A9K4_CAUVC|nr:hypothetical protein CC_0976 [Caulobacter vibrioides CB15]